MLLIRVGTHQRYRLILVTMADAKIDANEIDIESVEYIQQLASTDGRLESPIDLNMSHMTQIQLPPLQWLNYEIPPKKLKIANTGSTVIISAKWERERAHLFGGPFLQSFIFSQIHFHWGENDMSGSEHYVDGGRMPMELHAVHFKSDYASQEEALLKPDGIAILVYFFKLQDLENPYINEILQALNFIRAAHTSIRLVPSTLTNLIKPFEHDYFTYWGSIKIYRRPCSVLWLVSREPIGITSGQIMQFRTLRSVDETPILSNCRPLQDKQDRTIFYISPLGSNYATLLPVFRKYPIRVDAATDTNLEDVKGKEFIRS
ncbi:carbonic anhydrase 1-like [Prorops nasuta]|uniref:carbonic anhydrase 1-like n=1 Tax=Prorops nasuta TaxID=863751 RepID=UPI0034CF140B